MQQLTRNQTPKLVSISSRQATMLASSTLSPMSSSAHLYFVVRGRQTNYGFPVWHHSIWDGLFFFFFKQKEKKSNVKYFKCFLEYLLWLKSRCSWDCFTCSARAWSAWKWEELLWSAKSSQGKWEQKISKGKCSNQFNMFFLLWSDWKHLSCLTLLLFLNLPLPFPFLKLRISVNFY